MTKLLEIEGKEELRGTLPKRIPQRHAIFGAPLPHDSPGIETRYRAILKKASRG